MFIYFGKMPVHEIPLMFFVLGTFYFYLTNRFRPMAAFIILAILTTWPGYFLIPAITIHSLITRKFNKKLLILWIFAPLLFLLHLLHNYSVTGDLFGGGLREIFLLRISGVSLVPYITTLARWSWTYYFLLIPLSLVGLFKSKRKDISLIFLVYAICYPIIFRDASFRHDYLLIYFWPFLALSSALVIKKYFLAFFVIAVIVVFRWNFIMALENSDIYKESVRFGQYINANSSPKEKIQAITADPSVPWDGWFIGYYADRSIVNKNPDRTFYYNPGGKMSFK